MFQNFLYVFILVLFLKNVDESVFEFVLEAVVVKSIVSEIHHFKANCSGVSCKN